MIEFDDSDLRNLQEVNGIVLQDVHGKRVAIGYGFEYENIFEFMDAYFEEYGADDFAKQIGYEDAADMFKAWSLGIPFYESYFTDWVYSAFDEVDADSLQDQYDHKNEDRLAAEDHKLDQALGK